MTRDWETDPRPLSECLKAWHGRLGWTRARAASELRVPIATYHEWCDGRPCRYEAAFRLLMSFLEQK